MAYPLLDKYGISSPYGPRPGLMGDIHKGTDMPTPVGVDIPAVAAGTVYMADWITFTNAGKTYRELLIIINRPDGYFNIYDHLSAVNVKAGQAVAKGQIIGKTGNTGFTTGPHLHLQKGVGRYTGGLFDNYATVNPEPELRAWSLQGGATGGNDVSPDQSFAEVFIAIAQRWPNQSEIDKWKGSGLPSYTWCQKYAPNPAVNDRVALQIYHQARIDAGKGRNPDGSIYPAEQFAADRLAGGADFKAVISGDMAAYLGTLDSLEAQLKASNTTNASLRANIEAEAQRLSSAALEKVKDESFKVAYLTQTGENPPSKQVEEWKRSTLSADEWVRKYVGNDQMKAIIEQLDAATISSHRLNETVTSLETSLKQAGQTAITLAEQKEQAESAAANALEALAAERVISEDLRNQLQVALEKARPTEQWTFIQLLLEAVKRLKGGSHNI